MRSWGDRGHGNNLILSDLVDAESRLVNLTETEEDNHLSTNLFTDQTQSSQVSIHYPQDNDDADDADDIQEAHVEDHENHENVRNPTENKQKHENHNNPWEN